MLVRISTMVIAVIVVRIECMTPPLSFNLENQIFISNQIFCLYSGNMPVIRYLLGKEYLSKTMHLSGKEYLSVARYLYGNGYLFGNGHLPVPVFD
jgi:hypothetical protein